MCLKSFDRLDHDGGIQVQTFCPLDDLLVYRLLRMIHNDNALLVTQEFNMGIPC